MKRVGIKKINKQAKRLGQKVKKDSKQIGRKINSGLKQVDRKVVKAHKVIDAADDGLRILNDAGLKNIPIGGALSSAAEKGLHKARKTVDKAARLNQKARKVHHDLEKINFRKKQEEHQDSDMSSHFA